MFSPCCSDGDEMNEQPLLGGGGEGVSEGGGAGGAYLRGSNSLFREESCLAG